MSDAPGATAYGFIDLGGGYWQAARSVTAVTAPSAKEREKGWGSVVYAGGQESLGGGRLCTLPVDELLRLVDGADADTHARHRREPVPAPAPETRVARRTKTEIEQLRIIARRSEEDYKYVDIGREGRMLLDIAHLLKIIGYDRNTDR